MKVRDPGGQTWRVTRRWVPWRRRTHGLDSPDLPIGDLGDEPVSLVLGLIALVVLVPVVIASFVVALELLLLLLLLPLALLGRVLLGHHWTVEARRGFRIWWEASAGDWQASGDVIHRVADEIRRGDLPSQVVGAPSTPRMNPD